MISEDQQEQAVLYALGLLDAEAAAEFESRLAEEPGLREFARDCQEAAASLALAAGPALAAPPESLKERIMGRLETASGPSASAADVTRPARTLPVAVSPGSAVGASQVEPPAIAARRYRFPAVAVPWAIAALLMIGCYLLLVRNGGLEHENQALQGTLLMARNATRPVDASASPAAPELLASVAFCQMQPTAGEPVAQPRAAVAWDAARQEGVIEIVQLTPPANGKDYQLWAVEDGRKDAVSAGVVHVDAQGRARTLFKPEAPAAGSGAANARVLAFALSLEQAGGVPVNAGPILLIGKL